MITQTVYSILSGASAITTLTDRIFPSVIPQQARYPAMSFSKIDTRFLDSFDGHNPFTRATFQFDCYAKTLLEAESIAAAVKTTLIDYSSSVINRTRIDNEFSLFETETELHRALLQFTIWHWES